MLVIPKCKSVSIGLWPSLEVSKNPNLPDYDLCFLLMLQWRMKISIMVDGYNLVKI